MLNRCSVICQTNHMNAILASIVTRTGTKCRVMPVVDHIVDMKRIRRKNRVSDIIKHPSHYTEGRKYEPKDVILGLGFEL